KTPPKFPRRSAEYARYKAMTRCTGAGQSWTMQARSTGRPPLQFAPGQLKACVTFDATKHHRYSDLKSICAVLTACADPAPNPPRSWRARRPEPPEAESTPAVDDDCPEADRDLWIRHSAFRRLDAER